MLGSAQLLSCGSSARHGGHRRSPNGTRHAWTI